MSIRTRFAPSPTGQLHLGHARAAFEAFGFAAERHGTCLLRIEDIDHTRCKPEFTRSIYNDLDWLGLDWPLPVRVQSRHTADYIKVIMVLLDRGLADPCTLTRGEIKAGRVPRPDADLTFSESVMAKWSDCSLYSLLDTKTGGSGYTESTRKILSWASDLKNPELPFTLRLDLQASLDAVSDQSLTYQEFINLKGSTEQKYARPLLRDMAASTRPDPVIARRDIGTSYDIAVTHDDALQGITHVVRGRDLADQTPLHVLIQNLMGWPTPTYYHHDLVLREDGEKLAKRNLDAALASLRGSGQSVAEVKRLAGWTDTS